MKFLVAFLLVLVYSKVDAVSDDDLIQIRDSSVTAYSNLESGSAYLNGLNFGPQVTAAVEALSTLNALATFALPPYNYPVLEEIASYDGSPALSDIVTILQIYASDAPPEYRTYLENAYVYTVQTRQAVRNIAHS